MTRSMLVRAVLRLAEDADHHEARARDAYATARKERRRAAQLRAAEREAIARLRDMGAAR